MRLGYHNRNSRIDGIGIEHAHLKGLVSGSLLAKLSSLELLLATTSNLLILCQGCVVPSEAVNGRVDVAADGLANALHDSLDEKIKLSKHKTYVTLGEEALQAFSSLGALGTTSGGSSDLCGWVVGSRGIGAREVVCRHDVCDDRICS